MPSGSAYRDRYRLILWKKIRDLKENDGVFSFLYGGDIHRLLETLSAGTITDLSISDPDLDEIFLHYYENGGEQV